MANFAVPNHSSYFDLGDKIVAYTPKVASTSIHRALRAQAAPKISQQMVVKRKAQGASIILFVRHPIERLVSAHAMFTKTERVNPGIPENFSDFVDWVLLRERKKQDEHWLPQTDYHTYHGQYLPTIHYPLEHVQEIWASLIKGQLQKLNVNQKRPAWEPLFDSLSNEQQVGLLTYYAEDIRVYEKAVKEFNARLVEWQTHCA